MCTIFTNRKLPSLHSELIPRSRKASTNSYAKKKAFCLYKGGYSLQIQVQFGKPRVMGAIESLGCNWWKNVHQIDAYPEVNRITYCYNFFRNRY